MTNTMDGLIVDSFAGGGGASLGIEMALGRSPDIAINHDAAAIAMHQANHPDTLHLSKNIWQVDPVDYVKGRKVSLAWFSPDCKHFSKAKGGKPVARNIRDLAWVVVLWAERVKPDIIMLENVEEFRTWGPLTDDDKPCPVRKGETFRKWTGQLRKQGYRVQFRELRACDYGVPTIRKRLFMIARRDGKPIVWPDATHGPPGDPDVIAGRKLPWRTAAEIIDWSLPCHSIFLTREEGRAVNVKRPLAENTMIRIAKGVFRYVINHADPFVVSCEYGEDRGIVSPVFTYAQQGGAVRAPDEPMHTVTASKKDQNSVIVPHLQAYYGKGNGGQDRSASVADPLKTVVTENRHAVIVPHLMTMRNSGKPHTAADDPLHTVTANGAHKMMVTSHLSRQFGKSVGSDMDEPMGAVMPGGGGKTALVSAFLAQHNTGVVGHDGREPVSTITQRGTQQAVVTSSMINLKGSDRRMSPTDEPVQTVTSGGLHIGEVRAFLTKYYGTGGQWQDLRDPVHTVPTRDRMGLVTIKGVLFQISDICMRMLVPRELFRAQGFPDTYIIDPVFEGKPLSKTKQIEKCGNSVAPAMAKALVEANMPTPMQVAAE